MFVALNMIEHDVVVSAPRRSTQIHSLRQWSHTKSTIHRIFRPNDLQGSIIPMQHTELFDVLYEQYN